MKDGRRPAIVLFVYNRLFHTQKTIEALKKNVGSEFHDLIVYSDGPRTAKQASAVNAVRGYIGSISGFASVSIRERKYNLGLSCSIITGVTEVLEDYDQIIVLEDDIVTSPYFLDFMTNGLKQYEDDERVVSVHGYVYPLERPPKTPFFLRGTDCWGWGTWRRAWKIFNPNGQYLLDQIISRQLLDEFDFGGKSRNSAMLRDQIVGKNDSWAIRWHASAFLAEGLTLYPGKSLVQNIGNDNSGTHCGETSDFHVELASQPIDLANILVEQSAQAVREFEKFYTKRFGNSLSSSNLGQRVGLKSRLRTIYHDLVPPVVARRIRKILRQNDTQAQAISFEGPFGDWAQARKKSTGYDASQILEKVLYSTLMVKNGKAVAERDSVILNSIEYSWPITAYLMRAAALSKNRLRVLDFGGALGSSYFQNLQFISDLDDVMWYVLEQKHFVSAGRKKIQTDSLRFIDSVSELPSGDFPNFVLLSSVLQYLEEPMDELKRIMALEPDFIAIDRTPVSSVMGDAIFVQNVPNSIYKASYPMRILIEEKILSTLGSSYSLVSRFKALDGSKVTPLGVVGYNGYIFQRRCGYSLSAALAGSSILRKSADQADR